MNKRLEKSGPFTVRLSAEKENKTGTSKVGVVSKAQKAQKIFFSKFEIFEFFSFRKCRIVPKNVNGGGPFGLY